MTRCERTRDRLLGGGESPELRAHLETCPACARFAERVASARQALRQHHAGVEPDAGFAARVAVRVRHDPSQMLGWAAVRLLPATLALVIVLGWLASGVTVRTSETVVADEGASDDLLVWLLEDGGNE